MWAGDWGYAPQGFLTEKGRDKTLLQFGLIDSGAGYPVRTALNVLHSDVTLWFGEENTPGFNATYKKAKKYGKPFRIVTYADKYTIYYVIKNYNVINVAGNRESVSPGIQEATKKRLKEVFWMLKKSEDDFSIE